MGCDEILKTEIDGVKYSTTLFPARRGLAVKTKLLKLLAPLSSGITPGAKSVLNIAKVFESMDESTASSLMLELLSYSFRDEKRITPESFDMDFAGGYVSLYKVIIWVVEVNHFFGDVNIGEMLLDLQMNQ